MYPNINICWASLLVEELVRQGVSCFVVSPGSRSAPLALALAAHSSVHPVFHCDERGAAFYALGHARATGQPSVWITTSGTAVANGLPAIIEAAMDGIPLLAITADRPPELRDTRANQTIHQPGIFSPYTKWNVDLPCPDKAVPPSYVLTTAGQAMAAACGEFPGPVHLNAMFREPLDTSTDEGDYASYLAPISAWQNSSEPFTKSLPCPATPAPDAMRMVVAKLKEAKQGVLIAGRMGTEHDRVALQKLATLLSWPVLPDVLSGLRAPDESGYVIPFADQILLEPSEPLNSDLILQVGAPSVSKRIAQWAACQKAERITIKPHRDRQDSAHVGGLTLSCGLSEFVHALEQMDVQVPLSQSLEDWRTANSNVWKVLNETVSKDTTLDEIYMAHKLSSAIPVSWSLFLGNSMPIRDMDMYASPETTAVSIGANRGASGIDGLVASACGWARAVDRPTALLIGDLSLLHDLNSLDFVRRSSVPVVIVVVNNDGGGIFSFLPVSKEKEHFEKCFGTPHGLKFEQAAAMFDLPYLSIDTCADYDNTLKSAFAGAQSMIIEVRTNRAQNAERHVALQARIRSALKEG